MIDEDHLVDGAAIFNSLVNKAEGVITEESHVAIEAHRR